MRQKIRNGLLIASMLAFPVTLNWFSPYLIMWSGSLGIVNGSFILFSGLFVSALVLGRAFCGWVCPAGCMQEICFRVNSKPVRKGDWLKWAIWAPWIAMTVFFAVKAGGYKKFEPLFAFEKGFSLESIYNYIIYYSVLALMILPAFIIGKRSFCHHLCWMAPFMIIGRKLRNAARTPALVLVSDGTKCVSCGTCTKNCPMSLEAGEMVKVNRMEKTECILCGTCADNCASKAIKLVFR